MNEMNSRVISVIVTDIPTTHFPGAVLVTLNCIIKTLQDFVLWIKLEKRNCLQFSLCHENNLF